MKGYGSYVWSAFSFTLISFATLYVLTKINLVKEQNKFTVKFHGVRGSIPSPLASEEVEGKLVQALQKAKPEDLADEGSIESFVQGLPHEVRGTFGGNSSCVTVQVGDELLIFDAGSGIRMLGQDLMATGFGRGQGKAHMFFSHTHWDHILGIPFFVPFYIAGFVWSLVFSVFLWFMVGYVFYWLYNTYGESVKYKIINWGRLRRLRKNNKIDDDIDWENGL